MVTALPDQQGIEAEGREGGEASKDPGDQEQSGCIIAAAVDEPAGKETHDDAPDDVHEQRSGRKAGAKQQKRCPVYAVPKRCANAAAHEDDEVAHAI